jgi:hypothetical protein
MSRRGKCPHCSNRPKVEEIIQVECLRCAARPGQWCPRGPGEFTRSEDQARAAAGTAPSHDERKWLAQGHTPEKIAEMAAARRQTGRIHPVPDNRPRNSRTHKHVFGYVRACRCGELDDMQDDETIIAQAKRADALAARVRELEDELLYMQAERAMEQRVSGVRMSLQRTLGWAELREKAARFRSRTEVSAGYGDEQG